MATCPIRVVEQYVAVETALGWSLTEDYLFLKMCLRPKTGAHIGGKTTIQTPDMTKPLNLHVRHDGERTSFTMHSFR